jgi:hypothetical protein
MAVPGGNGTNGSNGHGPGPQGAARRLVELDSYVQLVGGRAPENFPRPTYPSTSTGRSGGEPVPGRPGRFLLRLISVQPDRCPPQERMRFYLMAATVLLNAGVAAYSVPTGLSVAFPGLHGIARIGLGLLGAGVVGVMDALIVGHWVSPARYRVNPPAVPPELPVWWRRLGVFIPRLGFTFIIVFGLGLMLALSANKGVIAKQAALDAISDRNAAIASAQALDDQLIQQDTTKLTAAEKQLTAAQNQETAAQNRASCELYGKPRVPGCSPTAGNGPDYRHFESVANGPDKEAVTAAQNEVNSISTELNQARADKAQQAGKGNIKVAAAIPDGLSAVNAEWNQYADSHHLSWVDRYLMDLIILGVDLVPIGMKFFGGITIYEAAAWEFEWNEAVTERRRRGSEHKRLATFENLYAGAADAWQATRLRILRAWLEADADNPGEPILPLHMTPVLLPTKRLPRPSDPPGTPGTPGTPGPDVPPDLVATVRYPHLPAPVLSGQVPTAYYPPPTAPDLGANAPYPPPTEPGAPRTPRRGGSSSRPGERPDPLREGRDAAVGDVVQLSQGQYELLAQITNRTSYNGDVFIAGLVRYPGQVAPVGRDIPLRAVKFTRTSDQPKPAEFAFVNRFPAPGETLLRTMPRPTAGNLCLIYESQYFPRSDVMRYLYGSRDGAYPGITVGQVIEIMRCLSDAQRRIWEEGFLHNDTRLRNLIMTGPLEDGRYNPDQLTPAGLRPGAVMLCDWGSMSFIGEPFNPSAGITASLLDGDPAIFRALLGLTGPSDPGTSPLSIASDQYGAFSCAYQLLTGGISPMTGLLVYRYGNNPNAVAQLEAATYDELLATQMRGWPDALTTDPLPVQMFNPRIPGPLAELVDAGVRADPLQREPALFRDGGIVRPHDAATVTEEALTRVSEALTGAELQLPLAGRHDGFLWGLDAPVGWPEEILAYVAEKWPEYGVSR